MRRLQPKRRELLTGLAFAGPWLVGLTVFIAYPFVAAIGLSGFRYSTLEPARFVALGNFRELAFDQVFWTATFNTLYFAGLSIPLGVVLSLTLAILLNSPIRGRSIYRTIFYLPHLLPPVAVAVLWIWLFNGQDGLVNHGLRLLGWVNPPTWLQSPRWAMPTIVLASLWGIGNAVVIYLAALQEVPREMYEAAEIDGAGPWHKLRHVTLPLISPIILFNTIMGIIGSFQYFTEPYMMTRGGPARSTTVLAMYVYETAFMDLRMGYACAMAAILFLIILGLTALALRASRRLVYYGGR